jgi:hypothetical protein
MFKLKKSNTLGIFWPVSLFTEGARETRLPAGSDLPTGNKNLGCNLVKCPSVVESQRDAC